MRKEDMDEKLRQYAKQAKYGVDPEDQPGASSTDEANGPRSDSRYTDYGADPREEWPHAEKGSPLPLLPELPKPQPFPIEALPVVMRDAVVAIAAKVQVGDDLAAQSVLATAALALQSFADVRMPSGGVCPLSLFFYSVAATGERKTSADKEA